MKTDMDSKKEMEEKDFDYEPGFLYDFDEEAFKEYIVPAIFSMLTSLLVGFGISHIRYRMGSKDSRYPPFNDLDDGWHTSNLPPSRNSLYDIQIYSKTDLQIQEMET